jgi:hypothetical protein
VQGRELQVAKKRGGRCANEFRRPAVERLKSCDNIVALSLSTRSELVDGTLDAISIAIRFHGVNPVVVGCSRLEVRGDVNRLP